MVTAEVVKRPGRAVETAICPSCKADWHISNGRVGEHYLHIPVYHKRRELGYSRQLCPGSGTPVRNKK